MVSHSPQHRPLDREEMSAETLTWESSAVQHDYLKASGLGLGARVAQLERQFREDRVARLQLERRFREDRIRLVGLILEFKRDELKGVEVESILICLRVFDDVVFEETRTGGLTKREQWILEQRHISSITELIRFDVESFEATYRPLSKMSLAFLDIIDEALLLLSPEEIEFCKVLEAKLLGHIGPFWHRRHPTLDARTVRNSIRAFVEPHHLATLDAMINANHQRMWRHDDDDETDRSVFATPGSSDKVSLLKNEIIKLEGELEKLKAELAGQGETDAGGDQTLA